MSGREPTLVLDPRRALTLDLARLDGGPRRALLRALLALSGGAVAVEGAARAAAAPEPALFALTHHNAWEAVLAPAALIAVRGGRPVRFLVDWMFVELPGIGWLLRCLDPIPVYGKRARFRWRERRRLAGREGEPALERALAALAAGDDIGVYPEGRRNPDPFLLARPRRGLALLALRSGAPVIPIGIDFAARDRLRRTPRAGRFVLRVGEPLRFEAENADWRASAGDAERRRSERRWVPEIAARVHGELARLARKVHVGEPDRKEAAMQSETASKSGNLAARSAGEPAAGESAPASGGGLSVQRVADPRTREAALAVVREVYAEEKGWLADVAPEIAPEPALEPEVSWFLATLGGEPVGVVRLRYDPELELPPELGVELDPGVDLARLAEAGRFVEVGRLMIRARWRARPAVVLGLLRGTMAEVVERGYTHLLTVVFEDDPHSPLRFHTRQLGFERIGAHRQGELACSSRRILLVLDLARAYRRLRERGSSLVGHLTRGFGERLASLGGEAR